MYINNNIFNFKNKRLILILNKIYGLNTNQINYILSNLGINSNLMINNLTPLMLKQINDFITKHYIINNDLQYKTTNNKKLKNDINLNLYKIFYEVALSESISDASKKMFITQSAVSKAIKKLEEDLFEDTGNKTRGI